MSHTLTVRLSKNLATWLEEQPDGTIVEHKTAWTDLLLRENGQWSWIGDHGHTVNPN